jgi:hypothetical protein
MSSTEDHTEGIVPTVVTPGIVPTVFTPVVERNAAGFAIQVVNGVPCARVVSSTNTFFLPLDHDIFDTDTTTTVPTVVENNRPILQPDTQWFDVEVMTPDLHHLDLEICGLANSSNGRACSIHNVCGNCVVVGDVLRLREVVADINGEPELAILLVKIVEGRESCRVGYVPRMQAKLPIVMEQIGRFCMVTELYKDSFNTYKRRKDNSMMGAGLAVLLDTIPHDE